MACFALVSHQDPYLCLPRLRSSFRGSQVILSQSLFCSPRIDESTQELSWSYYMDLGPIFIHNLCMQCHLPTFLWLSCPRVTFFLGVQLFSTFFKVWS